MRQNNSSFRFVSVNSYLNAEFAYLLRYVIYDRCTMRKYSKSVFRVLDADDFKSPNTEQVRSHAEQRFILENVAQNVFLNSNQSSVLIAPAATFSGLDKISKIILSFPNKEQACFLFVSVLDPLGMIPDTNILPLWDPDKVSLVLSGKDSLMNYQKALRLVEFKLHDSSSVLASYRVKISVMDLSGSRVTLKMLEVKVILSSQFPLLD